MDLMVFMVWERTSWQALVDEGKVYDHCVAIGPMIMMKFVCILTKKIGDTYDCIDESDYGGRYWNVRRMPLIVGGKVKFACVDGPEFDGHQVDFDLAMKRQQQYKTQEGRAMLKLTEGDTHHGGCGNCGGDNE